MFGGRFNRLTASLIRRIRTKFLARSCMKKRSFIFLLKGFIKAYKNWAYYNRLVSKMNKAMPGLVIKYRDELAKNTEQQVQADSPAGPAA